MTACNNHLLFYPGNPEVSGQSEEVKELNREIEHTGFKPITTYEEHLLHENIPVKGHI